MTPRKGPSIADRFQDLLWRITPTDAELAQAEERYEEIRTRLERSFHGKPARLVGSLRKDSFVRGHSDVDIFAPLSVTEARWGENMVDSRTFLKRVRDELRVRYPSTQIQRDGQAVSLQFARGIRNFDVVPAIFVGIQNACSLYGIPDGKGGWIATSPDMQLKRLENVAQRSGNKLPRVIKLLKWWARERPSPLPLKSFHIEMVLAHAELGVGAASYAQLTAAAFWILADRKARAFRDPFKLSGLIPAADTETKKRRVAAALSRASTLARDAVEAEALGDTRRAVRLWNHVFNGTFA